MPDSVNFDRAADFYDATRGFAPGEEEPAVRLIAETGNLSADSCVLEIGIGTGRIAVPLSAHTGAYYGVDISTAMMGKIPAKPGGERVRLAESDALRLPFANDSFDAAVVVHVFHLVADAVQMVRELARVVKSNGVVLHCRNNRVGGLSVLSKVWDRATQDVKSGEKRWNQVDDLLENQGWEEIATTVHDSPSLFTPRGFLDHAQKRTWSSTWRISDALHTAGIAAVRSAIDEHYDGNLDYEAEGLSQFLVAAYRPPQGQE